nr:response regulator transcription factor [Pseudoalteromonas sp. MM17-2]
MIVIKVAVVDDQNLVLEGLCSLLALHPDLQVSAQRNHAEHIVTWLTANPVDVLVLDVRMPTVSGIDALREIRNAKLPVAVMLLSTFDEHDLVLKSIRLGADGYLRKDISFAVLTDAIIALSQGQRWLQPAVTQTIACHASRPNNPPLYEFTQYETLSLSELEILRLVAAGFSNAEIAEALYKSAGTVRNQVSAILAKLMVRDRTRAVLRGIELGLI